jgi:CRISPR-associated protein Cmr5
MTSNTQTLQQKRAQRAWEDVQSVRSKPDPDRYGSLVRGLPAMIKSQGLAPTLAFLDAKGKPHHKAAHSHLSRWVLGQLGAGNEQSLLEWVIKQDSAMYRRATTEAIEYLTWLKRFAEASDLGSVEGDKN